jgi:hypothetical protein
MTGIARIPRESGIILPSGAYTSDDLARMQGVIDAVCVELGIPRGPAREIVARRVIAAYDTGRRHPLNLVDAGLGGAGF